MSKQITAKQAATKSAKDLGIKVFKSWTIGKIEQATKKEISRIKGIIKEILATSEKYKSCFFWANTGNSSSRRRQEFDDYYDFTFGGKTFNVNQYLRISCQNFYFTSNIEVNGKKSNLTPLKNIIAKLNA